jgi:predicted phage-related endonuclease
LAPEPISFKGPPGLQGKRRSFMDQNSNYITIEASIRLQMKDYRLVLGMKRTWIIALVVGGIQLIVWAIKGHHL